MAAMLKSVGIAWEDVDYSGSYGDESGTTFFQYKNILLAGLSLPYISGASLFSFEFFRVALEYLRFSAKAPRHLAAGLLAGKTFGEYLAEEKYSELFVRRVLLTALAVMCTCRYETMAAFPADMVVFCLTVRSGSGIQRARGGNEEMAKRLSTGSRVVCNARVTGVAATVDGRVTVSHEGGPAEVYDHVIFATQANHVPRLLKDMTAEEASVFASFEYEPSAVVVHTDPTVMPLNPGAWSGVNFAVPTVGDMPSATIWLNRVNSEMKDEKQNVFQTWNPLRPIPEHATIHVSQFERPTMTPKSVAAIARLQALQGKRNIWFCGSYALQAMPLLENGVSSAIGIANALGVEQSWGVLPERVPVTLFSPSWFVGAACWATALAVVGTRIRKEIMA